MSDTPDAEVAGLLRKLADGYTVIKDDRETVYRAADTIDRLTATLAERAAEVDHYKESLITADRKLDAAESRLAQVPPRGPTEAMMESVRGIRMIDEQKRVIWRAMYDAAIRERAGKEEK